jgi:hypothetical protein
MLPDKPLVSKSEAMRERWSAHILLCTLTPEAQSEYTAIVPDPVRVDKTPDLVGEKTGPRHPR